MNELLTDWIWGEINPLGGLMESLGYLIIAIFCFIFGIIFFLRFQQPYLRIGLGIGMFCLGAVIIMALV
jgi:hypothetical protein